MQLIRSRNKQRAGKTLKQRLHSIQMDRRLKLRKKLKSKSTHLPSDKTHDIDEMSDFLCIGDYVCLYCEETEGYVFSFQTSSVHNGVFVYNRQDRDKPDGIPNPMAVVFQVCIQNRYKLNKKYRKIQEISKLDPENLETKALAAQAKAAAEAEQEDNVSEQRRQTNKKVRYGEILQLKHVFTGTFIHTSTTQTSQRDKNNMMVSLQSYNAKHSQFRLLPRYKVKSEGEVVQILDQIVFESVKSPGCFLHASVPFHIDHFHIGSEMNLGVDVTGFTVVKHSKPSEALEPFVKGGSALRLFHKELEAYLVAEGLYDEQLVEDVHLRIREVDQLVPRTLYPSTAGITYWQVEAETSILNGEVIRWEQQVRFRHMPTRLYLCMNPDMQIALTAEAKDPNTVFRLHPIVKETDEIQFESYARIEHVLTGFWLHALRDEEYVRRQLQGSEDDNSMKGLRWDGAVLRKISASGERMYHDAYTIQKVEDQHLITFDFVAGMVPFLLNIICEFDMRCNGESLSESHTSTTAVSSREPYWRKDGKLLNAKTTMKICTALLELKNFMIVHGTPTKERQKLMRSLRIIDLLVRMLKFPLQDEVDESHLTLVFKAAYDVLHTYMIGSSRKNALYFAKYIDFFQTQFSVKVGDIGLDVAQMIVELIRDNRKIVDRITRQQIDEFVELLRENKNYRYLDLLGVLCVCDRVAIPDNQRYITEHWLMKDMSGVFVTERGQNIRRQTNVIFLSTDVGETWTALHDFVDSEYVGYNHEEFLFLEHQLDLFKNLCYARNEFAINVITRESNYLTWEEAFLCLRLQLLPDALRAKYCDLVIGLFVDVGNNFSILEYHNMSFVYDDIDDRDPLNNVDMTGTFMVKDLITIFPVLRDWIHEFLDENNCMIANKLGHNMLIEQVLRLLHFLVKFGYYGNTRDIQELQKPLLCLLDGKNDLPFPTEETQIVEKGKKKGYSKEAMKMIDQYRQKDRYEICPETNAIVNAKYQALEVLDVILTYQYSSRLRSFVAMFKQADRALSGHHKHRHPSPMQLLLSETFDALDQTKKGMRDQKKMVKYMHDMFEQTAFFDSNKLTTVLLDLTNYKYDKMVTKPMSVLNKYFSSKMDMFKNAVQAQVLITPDSVRVHRECLKYLPVLRRLTKSKLNDEQVRTMGELLDALINFLVLAFDEDERHAMNQSILINHEVLSLVFDILSQEIDGRLIEQYRGIKTIVVKTIRLLKALAHGNDVVQRRIYERMDTLLRVKVVEADVAIALQEAFIGNQCTCLKVQPKQIEKIVALIGEHQERVPEFLDLLCAIVKVEGMDIPLKRNQAYVMKYIMQTYSRTAFMFDQPRDRREKILTGQESDNHLRYLVSLVDLLATCAEGENRFIESLCQTILSMDELLWILTHDAIDNNIKKPFVKYLHWVYMRSSASFVDTGAGELTHDCSLWGFIHNLSGDIKATVEYLKINRMNIGEYLKRPPMKGLIVDKSDTERVAYANLHFLLDVILPMMRTFLTKFYSQDKDIYPQEPDTVDLMANALLSFCDMIKPHLTNPSHLKTIMASMTTVLNAATLPHTVIEGFIKEFGTVDWFIHRENELIKSHEQYYQGELELNARFRTFAVNCSLLNGGHNTVHAQLKHNTKWAFTRVYTPIGSDEALPLSEEFQDHIRCFLRPTEKKIKQYEMVGKLIEQIGISAGQSRLDEATRIEQEYLDIKCLQLLRAMIHNEIIRLPEGWEDKPHKFKKSLQKVTYIQNSMLDMGATDKILPMLGRSNDEIVKETLAFISSMLFNANRYVQKGMIDYFKATREEVFFLAVRNRMQLSTIAIKERRALVAQQEARRKEVLAQAKSLQSIMSVGKKALEDIQQYENSLRRSKLRSSRRTSLANLQFRASRVIARNKEQLGQLKEEQRSRSFVTRGNSVVHRKAPSDEELERSRHVHFTKDNTLDGAAGTVLDTLEEEVAENELEVKIIDDKPTLDGFDNLGFSLVQEELADEALEYKDEGYIELVLKVLAQMCDGQFGGLQDYLRDQPDNIKSFNIVAETTAFLNMVYSNINSKTIDLVIQLFSTLNEFAVGSQPNRTVICTNKVVEYINFILRAGEFKDCPEDKVLELRQVIANLLYSLIEENGPQEIAVAKEVKDTIDREALYRVMGKAYELHQVEKPKLHELIQRKNLLNLRGALESAKTLAKEGSKYMREVVDSNKPAVREQLMQLGFIYYLVLGRLYDIEPRLSKDGGRTNKLAELNITPEQQKAYHYYQKNCMSIEVLKDDCLQKITFRVRNKNVMRDEVKEKLKWSVDRSSPSNKIRDLMMWSKDILKDIYYQRRILSNVFAAILTKRWPVWNYTSIILSLAINILMLMNWKAPMSMADVTQPINASALPQALFDNRPVIMDPAFYHPATQVLGICHNVVSFLVLTSYFLSNHPTLPSANAVISRVKKLVGKTQNEDEEETESYHSAKLDVHFFSFKTFFYLVFFACSLGGTTHTGYWFAFHLLNIVNTNQLLSGVIQAVTQNGKSLLWVAILGLIIFYLYSLVGFAFFRDAFDPSKQLYCATLWQCTVTVIRYGLIGDYDEAFKVNAAIADFTRFSYMAIYQISFFIFITTIGLNIIFGIIVDTFSELRDLKWTAESDMRDTCFICSRKSYDFEHHAQGFAHHVKSEHNMWAYIFFLIHLDDTKPNDYTALDFYVANLLRLDRFDFFPLNRALSLTTMDEDSTESKIDELLHHVLALVQKQKEEESEKKRQEERMQQKRWHEIHRQQLRTYDTSHDPDVALRRLLQVRDTGRPDWYTVEFETTHL